MIEMDDNMRQELERLRAENQALKARSERSIHLKVSQKKGVSLYGIRRFPITFYMEEWDQILVRADEIREFIRKHEQELSKKGG
ncbi:MAG: hypothetical protein V3U03_03535 [Myxococcota bacterium]